MNKMQYFITFYFKNNFSLLIRIKVLFDTEKHTYIYIYVYTYTYNYTYIYI